MHPKAGAQDNAFALLCVQGNTRGSGDKSLERAFQSLSLKHHLETMHSAAEGSQMAFLPGAGATYMSGCDYALVENRWMAIFVGNIENYAYCVKKYCLEEAGLDVGSSYLLETVRALSPLNNAEVVAFLFKKLGPTFMSKLRGNFSFVVYDSQVSIKYIERTPIAAGEYKFGWRSVPIPYMASSETVMSKCSEARQAALDALASASVPLDKVAVASANRNVPRASNRRHTFTAQRPNRPSLSGIFNNITSSNSASAWNAITSPIAASPTRPGSYVPPHRRSMSGLPSSSLPVPTGPARAPPPMARNMPASRSMDRRTSLSDRAQSWRRGDSEELPRITPQDSAVGTPETFVPMLATAIEETDTPVAQASSDAARLTRALSSMHSTAEKSQAEDEEDALRAAPYYQAATASMLFKPASIVRRVPAPDAAARAKAAQEEPADATCSISDDDFVWPSHRSHPIPIRASRDSRPSFDVATKDVMAPADPASPLAEKNHVNSSVESLVSSSSDVSDTAAAEDKYEMERPSSLMFPCSDEGSSAPGSVPGLQGQLLATNTEAGGNIARKELSSPSLRSDTFRQPSTSRAASQAKELLDKVVQTINPASVASPATNLSDFPDIAELSFPSLKGRDMPSTTPMLTKDSVSLKPPNLGGAVAEEPGEASLSSEDGDTSVTTDDVAPVRPHVKGGMKASGSFSDALQLLLQSRAPGAPAAKVKQAFPRPRSGLVHVSPAAAVAPSPSSESAGARGDERVDPVDSTSAGKAAGSAVLETAATADSSSCPPVASLGSSSVPRDLHALPSSLLSSITGGDNVDAQEQAALASLLYSSPCALCILDARSPGQPVAYVNSKFHNDTGYGFDDAVGQPCRFLQNVPGGRRHPSLASVALDRALSRGRNYNGKVLNFGKDGNPLWNHLSIVPIRNKSDLEVTHFICLSTFTPADAQAAVPASTTSSLARGSSHQCLLSLEQESPARLLPQRSSSYMVLSSLTSGDAGTFKLVSN